MLLRDIVTLLTSTPHLGDISIDESISFVHLAKLVRPQIEFVQHDITEPPVSLPTNVHAFLSAALRKSETEIHWYWFAFRRAVWSEMMVAGSMEDVEVFARHGLSRSIGFRNMYPPTRVCLDPNCRNFRPTNTKVTLSQPNPYPATLFTLQHGCHRRYYHNYYTEKGEDSSRVYYRSAPPPTIQVSTHYFIDSSVLELFGNALTFAWMSANNCARMYNTSLAHINSPMQNNPHAYGLQPVARLCEDWLYSFEMTGDIAMNGFFLYSLLLDKSEHGTHLELPALGASQKDRLAVPLTERNKAMEGIGQEEWAHACNLCFRIREQEDGRFVKTQYAVGDGLSMGRPCCAVHDCKVDLTSNRDVYCPVHSDLAQLCAVVGCSAVHPQGFQTCDTAAHHSLELAYRKDSNRAVHQLRARLRASGASVPADAFSSLTPEDQLEAARDDEVMVMAAAGTSHLSGELSNVAVELVMEPSASAEVSELVADRMQCDGKSTGGAFAIKARFGRRRTHNEQLIARPCGVILSRATFFGSEAISGVKLHIKTVFPTPESMPEIFIYDNNCRLREHLIASGDHDFNHTGLPVDMFHFKTKHRITDTICQQYCNPASFPDLLEGDKWVVNTSICEETNSWLGGFMSIVREMEAVRYAFLLDEVIKRRNRFTVKQLERRGHNPWRIPMKALFPTLM